MSGENRHPLTSVSIRRAGPSDTRALEALTPVDISRLTDWQHLKQEGAFFTYLAEDSAPFGFVSAGEGEIVALFLKMQYRGYGMGRKLLVRGLSVLKRRRFDAAHIWLADSAYIALFMVKSIGFEPDGSERHVNDEFGNTSFELGYHLSLADYF